MNSGVGITTGFGFSGGGLAMDVLLLLLSDAAVFVVSITLGWANANADAETVSRAVRIFFIKAVYVMSKVNDLTVFKVGIQEHGENRTKVSRGTEKQGFIHDRNRHKISVFDSTRQSRKGLI